jgi:hypothetical protein
VSREWIYNDSNQITKNYRHCEVKQPTPEVCRSRMGNLTSLCLHQRKIWDSISVIHVTICEVISVHAIFLAKAKISDQHPDQITHRVDNI